jgi:hypothetical protein
MAVALTCLATPDAPAATAAPAPIAVSPPGTIPSNCSVDVSQPLQAWLGSLPAYTKVRVAPGACYLVDEGLVLDGAQGLTIAGGTWEDLSTPVAGASHDDMHAVFWLVGGSDVKLRDLTIVGSNPGGYDPTGAFEAGIRSDGVIGLDIDQVSVDGVYGDGIELAPLRGSDDLSGVIVNPSENVSISGVSIDGAGRQGITLASVTGATISDVTLRHIGIDVFDVEADQGNEGALDVTIDGCTDEGGAGGLFFANGGNGYGGSYTGNITVEDCTMVARDAGDAVLVQPPEQEPNPRGPITFLDDSLQCGSSVYVACVMAADAQLSFVDSTLTMPPGTIHENVYRAVEDSALTFTNDTVSGYGEPGTAGAKSTVTITGGSWVPYTPG